MSANQCPSRGHELDLLRSASSMPETKSVSAVEAAQAFFRIVSEQIEFRESGGYLRQAGEQGYSIVGERSEGAIGSASPVI